MKIRCPKCGKTGDFEGRRVGVVNDNVTQAESEESVLVPEGFRVVVFGWNSPYEYVACVDCGVGAIADREGA